MTPLTRGATRFEYSLRATSICRGSEHEGAQHPVFEGETRACFAAIHHQILCDDMQAWLGSAIRAFLDAYVRDEAVAAAYLGT